MLISKGYLISAIIGTAILGLLVWSFMPEPILVETAIVKEGPFQSSFSEDGKTRLRNRYTISAPFTGTLLRPRLKVGDKVNQGDVVANLYSAPSPLLDSRTKAELQERIGIAEANIEEATTQSDSAQMQFREAEQEYERIKSLANSGTASRQQLDRAQLARDIADRNLTAADRRRHAAEHMLAQVQKLVTSFNSDMGEDQFAIASPITGVIVKVYQESEGIISVGLPLVDIGDLQDLEIVAEILTTDLIDIKPGQKVIIDDWGGKFPLEGRVHRIEPAAVTKISALGIEEQRSTVVIDIVSPNEQWDRLGDQYSVKVMIITDEVENAVLIPTSALFRKNDGEYAFVVRGDRAKLLQIKVSQRSHGMAVVTSGVKVGDEIITYPPRELTDGMKIFQH